MPMAMQWFLFCHPKLFFYPFTEMNFTFMTWCKFFIVTKSLVIPNTTKCGANPKEHHLIMFICIVKNQCRHFCSQKAASHWALLTYFMDHQIFMLPLKFLCSSRSEERSWNTNSWWWEQLSTWSFWKLFAADILSFSPARDQSSDSTNYHVSTPQSLPLHRHWAWPSPLRWLTFHSRMHKHTQSAASAQPGVENKTWNILIRMAEFSAGETVLEGQDQQLACSLCFLPSQGLISGRPRESRGTLQCTGSTCITEYWAEIIHSSLARHILNWHSIFRISESLVWWALVWGFLLLMFFKEHSRLSKWKFSWINAVIK